MSDNVAITPGIGATIAGDDVGGIIHQRVKMSLGADGSATDALGGAGAVAAGVQRITLASDDPGVTALAAIQTAVQSTTPSPVQARNPDYETVAASATDQVMGATGAAGDYLSHVLITPATTSPGNVIIKDGSTTIFTFTGGASSVTTLIPFAVPLGLTAVTSWKITTGTNVSAIAVGDFT
jgi:hypothetical protein